MRQAKALLIVAVLVLAVFLSLPFPANADSKTAPKTLRVPDDYPTIEQAINASDVGGVITVENGTYDGPLDQELIINKAISIIGVGILNTTIVLHPAYTVTPPRSHYGQATYSYTNALLILTDNFQISQLTLKISPGGTIVAKGDKIQFASTAITGYTNFGVTGSYCQIIDCAFGGPVHFDVSFSEFARNSLTDLEMGAGHTNLIKDNTCSKIALASNFNNVIMGNTVSRVSGSTGITLGWTNQNFVYKNIIVGFSNALDIYGSSGNIVVANSVTSCSNLHFADASNNTFYLNNLLYRYLPPQGFYPPTISDEHFNTKKPTMPVSINSWDNGSVGNFWCYMNFRDPNGDRIGDAPNVINAVNQDNHPLLDRVDINSVNVELPNWALNTTNLYSNFPMPAAPSTPQKPNNSVAVVILTSTIIAAPLVAGTIMTLYYKKRKQTNIKKI
jgi:hypothetical protein